MGDKYNGRLSRAAEKSVARYHLEVARQGLETATAFDPDILHAVNILLRGGGDYVRTTASNLLGTMAQEDRRLSRDAKFTPRRAAWK